MAAYITKTYEQTLQRFKAEKLAELTREHKSGAAHLAKAIEKSPAPAVPDVRLAQIWQDILQRVDQIQKLTGKNPKQSQTLTVELRKLLTEFETLTK